MSIYNSESGESQNDSEYNYIPDYELQMEQPQLERGDQEAEEAAGQVPYADEPIADDEWLLEYNRQQEEKENQLREFQRRLDGTEPVRTWCNCGNCEIQLLQNASECYCCQEIESCLSSSNEDMVIRELGQPPSCITLHPGFRPVCLERWSLRLAADKYRCRDRRRYRQTGSEDRFLRSVSYREFTHLVHGHLGGKRIPLPACAYNAIRKTFMVENEEFGGFEVEDE